MNTIQALNMREWIQEGRSAGASYLIVIYDRGYDCSSPVFVFPEQNIQKEIEKAASMGDVKCITTLGKQADKIINKLVDPDISPLLISRIVH